VSDSGSGLSDAELNAAIARECYPERYQNVRILISDLWPTVEYACASVGLGNKSHVMIPDYAGNFQAIKSLENDIENSEEIWDVYQSVVKSLAGTDWQYARPRIRAEAALIAVRMSPTKAEREAMDR
jgi:hypothetical protein